MLTWAGLVAGVFAGLWLLTWAVQIAAVAMYGVAALVLFAARIAFGLGALAVIGALAVFAPPEMRRRVRRGFADGLAAHRGGPLVRLA